MGGLKTYGVLMCLIWALHAAPVRAGLSADDQLRSFAICAGRFSALLDHERLMENGAPDLVRSDRISMLELLDAVMPADRVREVLSWRINAKAAQAALLTRATFSNDAPDAAWAQQQSDRLVAECRAYLLT